MTTFVVLVLALALAPAVHAREVLDLLVGRWQVEVETLRPEPARIRYREEYRPILGGAYVEGRSEAKPDGSEDRVIGTYDANAGGYPFWFFSSTGSYTYLPPGTWDPRRRELVFENPPNWELVYRTVVRFPDERSREWEIQIKNWSGAVLVEQRGRAVRIER